RDKLVTGVQTCALPIWVDLARGRVRPSLSLDVAGGVQLYHSDHGRIGLQARVANLTNRLNVINFASLFSGTAIAPPRSLSLKLRSEERRVGKEPRARCG